jgi:hypothetical protein
MLPTGVIFWMEILKGKILLERSLNKLKFILVDQLVILEIREHLDSIKAAITLTFFISIGY